MPIKTMVFIDGSWLFHNRQHLHEAFGLESYDFDYSKIPGIIKTHLQKNLDMDVDIVRIFYFASIPINKPNFIPTKQQSFLNYLAHNCFYETEVYDIDFKNDAFSRPKEKCVDVAMASAVLYHAAIPNAYDIATIVAGDLDYLPMIRRVRALGKRTLLVALKEAGGYFPTSKILMDTVGLFDYPILFLDERIEELRLRRNENKRTCVQCAKEEPSSWQGNDFICSQCRAEMGKSINRACDACGKDTSTTWRGPVFYCDDCRKAHRSSWDQPSSLTSQQPQNSIELVQSVG